MRSESVDQLTDVARTPTLAALSRMDVAIVGGGVTGLLALHIAMTRGLSTKLFEAGELGGIQTRHSQAHLHRGVLYKIAAWGGRGSARLQTVLENRLLESGAAWWEENLETFGLRLSTDAAIYGLSDDLADDPFGAVRSLRDTGELADIAAPPPELVMTAGVKFLVSRERCVLNAESIATTLLARYPQAFERTRIDDVGLLRSLTNANHILLCANAANHSLHAVDDTALTNPTAAVMLLIQGPHVPRFPFALLWKNLWILCAPRGDPSQGEAPVWICSCFVGASIEASRIHADMREGLASVVKDIFVDAKTATHVDPFIPKFGDTRGGFVLGEEGGVSAVFPIRFTLAPLVVQVALYGATAGGSVAAPISSNLSTVGLPHWRAVQWYP